MEEGPQSDTGTAGLVTPDSAPEHPQEPPSSEPVIPEHATPHLLDYETRKTLIERVGQQVAGPAIVKWDEVGTASTLVNRVRDIEDIDLLRILADHEARNKARKGLLGTIEGRLSVLADQEAKRAAERALALNDDETVTAADVAAFGLALGVAAQTGGGAVLGAGGGLLQAPPQTLEVAASPPPAARSPFQAPTTAITTPLLRLKALVAFANDQPNAFPESMTRNADGVRGWILDGVRQSGWGNFATLDALAIDDADMGAIWNAVPADVRGHIESLSPADVAALAETL